MRRTFTAGALLGIAVAVVLLGNSLRDDEERPAAPPGASSVEATAVALATSSVAVTDPAPKAPPPEEVVHAPDRTPRVTGPAEEAPPREMAPRARRQAGGSGLYSGEAFLERVAVSVARATKDAKAIDPKVKAAQLERAADVAAKRGTIVGRIERVDATAIAGWAYAWDDPALPVTVDVFVDGKLAATVVAHERRAIAASEPANPILQRGWSLPAPASLRDGDRHVVTALAAKPGTAARHELMESPYHYGGTKLPAAELAHAGARVVYGWAIDPARPREPVEVELLADGKPLATVRTQPGGNKAVFEAVAPLLGEQGPKEPFGDEVQAFAFTTEEPLAASWVQALVVTADGLRREAARSPRAVSPDAKKNELPTGGVAFVSDVQVSGWAVDPDVSPGAISVDVHVDGVFVERLLANRSFAALPNFTSVKEPTHAFTFAPAEKYRDGRSHVVQFFAVNVPEGPNPELPGSPTTFVGKRNAPPQGWLDVATTVAGGWAYDPDAGSAPVRVEVWVDDALLATVDASGQRTDLVPIVAAEPNHGFSVPLPESLADGKLHVVRAFAVNVPDGPRQELNGSPKEINAQRPLIGIRLSDAPSGLTVDGVVPDSPAAAAGIQAGDVIRGFDDRTGTLDVAAFVAWAHTKEVGEQVVFTLWRPDSGERQVVVTIGSRS